MGISSALYSGVSGLNTNSQAMTVIGNNLANTGTIGFKGSRTVFSDLLSSTINGSGGASQVGRGVNVSKVDNIFSQGTFESTESGLDVAVEGDGFFLVSEEGSDAIHYTRAGAFRFDENGFLVNPEGFRVQGKEFDVDGELVAGDPDDIQIGNTGLIAGNATDTMTLTTNLDAAAEVLDNDDFDYTDPATFNYSSSTQVFDSLGEPHLITTYFIKTDDNEWQWTWTAEDDNGDAFGPDGILNVNDDGDPENQPARYAGDLDFNNEGTFLNPEEQGNDPPFDGKPENNIGDLDWGNGSDPNQEIEITFDTTQFDSQSTIISQDQNGFGAGNLTSVDIDGEGVLIASYSNGEQAKVASLVLGKFNNPNGLRQAGNNLYEATETSGVPRVGLPGAELGKVFTNSLEQSNVDMGAEFVRMITVQRGFQANSKIITTVDELLGELINLKR